MPEPINGSIQQVARLLGYTLFSYPGGSVTVISLVMGILAVAGLVWIMPRSMSWLARRVLAKTKLERRLRKEAFIVLRGACWLAGFVLVVQLIGIEHWLVIALLRFQSELSSVVDLKLFTVGRTQLTLWTTIYLLVFSWLLVRLSGQLQVLMVDRALARTDIDPGLRQAFGTTLRYAVVLIGFVVILQSAGIDLSTLTVMVGALGVAIGLGLQSILSNLVGGLVILFERPIKLGDRIEVGNYSGNVTQLSLRATTIVTNDHVAIIVPNSEFTASRVVNWTHDGHQCRFRIPVKVLLGADPETVKALLLEIAAQHQGVLKLPAPRVLLEEFSDNYLSFALLVWTCDYVEHPADLKSDINFAIMDQFARHSVLLQGQAVSLPVSAPTVRRKSERSPDEGPAAKPAVSQSVLAAGGDRLRLRRKKRTG